MADRPRVLLATDSLDPSGVGQHMLTLARGLAPNLDVALAFAPAERPARYATAARAEGLETHPLADDPEALIGSLHLDLLHVYAGIAWEGHTLCRAGGIAGRPVLVWGGGTVGLLTALFARLAGAEVMVAEPDPWRRALAGRLGFEALDEQDAWVAAKSRWHGSGGRVADFVFQTRARSESLALALRALRPRGVVIDLAFYQGGMDGLRLGEEFHHNGLSIRCAQIGRVPRGFDGGWDRRRLANETLALLAAEGAAIREHLITHVVPFEDGADFLRRLIVERPPFLQIVFAG